MSTRWGRSDAPRGEEYDDRWRQLATTGQGIHGEADLVEALLRRDGGARVLDAGCGTGRVAIELAARGLSVVGVDADAAMLATAREKAPHLRWVEADLVDIGAQLTESFDLAVLAGNVMIFVSEGTEAAVVAAVADRVVPGGLVLAGFQLRPGGLTVERYDDIAAIAGLEAVDRWSTWDSAPYTGGDYAVSLHRVPVTSTR